MKRVVVAIYTDPDFYPPTINAILNLAGHFDEVVVVSRNNSKTDFPFPQNVSLRKTGKCISVADAEKKGVGYKIISFTQFVLKLLSNATNRKTSLLIIYDPFPLLAFSLIRKFIPRRIKTWYHNHDMPDSSLTRKYTIGGYAAVKEHATMRYIDYFSLPSQDRLAFYSNWQRPANYFYIPNYPSLQVYTERPERSKQTDTCRIIFQGAIGEGHALEEIIELLTEKIENRSLQLIVKGPVREPYKQKLTQLAVAAGVSERLTWIGIGPYAELPQLTSSCDIGIAIYMGKDNISRTLGTASNKIYEYAASGLPVILYDDSPFTRYLQEYKWTFFTNGSKDDLRDTIATILNEIDDAGKQAFTDFSNGLNFEKAFLSSLNTVLKAIGAD